MALIHAAAGGVGALLVQSAKMRGAQLANETGADHTIDYKAVDFADAVREWLQKPEPRAGRRGADLATADRHRRA